MPTPSYATRLMRQARPLQPARAPYYLHTPGGPAEPAPGWYMRDTNDLPIYLGAQTLDAVRAIDRLLELAKVTA